MSTADSNETSTILALIEQNFALQKSLVEIIKARDANEAEYRTNEQVRAENESERQADEAKAQDEYYKSLASMFISTFIPIMKTIMSPGPQVEVNAADFFGIDSGSEQQQQPTQYSEKR